MNISVFQAWEGFAISVAQQVGQGDPGLIKSPPGPGAIEQTSLLVREGEDIHTYSHVYIHTQTYLCEHTPTYTHPRSMHSCMYKHAQPHRGKLMDTHIQGTVCFLSTRDQVAL